VCVFDRQLFNPFYLPAGDSISSSDLEGRECTSGSVVDFDNDFSLESRSHSYTFLGDVNSLAWGICGDTYNQHKDTSFRELLFVSGSHGVTVHAFCEPNRGSAMARTAPEGDFGQGRWVEWGPSATLAQNMEVQEPSILCCEPPGNVVDVNTDNGTSEIPQNTSEVDDDLSRGVASKKWLQSFFVKAETIKSDDTVWTRFPEKSSIPCSAEVVSFSLFNSNLPLLDFYYKGNSESNKESRQETVLGSENYTFIKSNSASPASNFKSDVLSNVFGFGVNDLYKCSMKVKVAGATIYFLLQG